MLPQAPAEAQCWAKRLQHFHLPAQKHPPVMMLPTRTLLSHCCQPVLLLGHGDLAAAGRGRRRRHPRSLSLPLLPARHLGGRARTGGQGARKTCRATAAAGRLLGPTFRNPCLIGCVGAQWMDEPRKSVFVCVCVLAHSWTRLCIFVLGVAWWLPTPKTLK